MLKADPNSKTPILDLLSNPDHWTKNSAYRDNLKNPCVRSSATCCCLLGAISLCSSSHKLRNENLTKVYKAIIDINKLDIAVTKLDIVGFNDDPDTTHEDIIEVLEKAQV